MLSATCETFILDGHQIACSTSVGAALKTPCDGNTRNELLLKADTALYSAKHSGKARFIVFGESQTYSG
ncbi:diguanylate cyclase domain-containing protein [Cupriavidus basilensis]